MTSKTESEDGGVVAHEERGTQGVECSPRKAIIKSIESRAWGNRRLVDETGLSWYKVQADLHGVGVRSEIRLGISDQCDSLIVGRVRIEVCLRRDTRPVRVLPSSSPLIRRRIPAPNARLAIVRRAPSRPAAPRRTATPGCPSRGVVQLRGALIRSRLCGSSHRDRRSRSCPLRTPQGSRAWAEIDPVRNKCSKVWSCGFVVERDVISQRELVRLSGLESIE